MLSTLKAKSQITLPKEIVKKIGLSEGDNLEITEKDGIIYMIPVVVYPKKYVEDLQSEIKTLKSNISEGKQPVFNNIDDLISKLEEN